MILQPYSVAHALGPQAWQELGHSEHHSGLAEEGLVKALGDAVVLRGVVHHEFLLHSFTFQVVDKFVASIFPTSVRVQHTYLCVMLCLGSCLKLLIGGKQVALPLK